MIIADKADLHAALEEVKRDAVVTRCVNDAVRIQLFQDALKYLPEGPFILPSTEDFGWFSSVADVLMRRSDG